MVPYGTNVVALSPHGEFLRGLGANATSQFGEDGLIAACLDKFGTANQFCFEVGANDGEFFSNTHRLRCLGWRSLLIEANEKVFWRLAGKYGNSAKCILRRIGSNDLDQMLTAERFPTDLDLGVIDVDGQDWWAWNGMRQYKPRLMLVEFEYGSDDGPLFIPPEGGSGQASHAAILTLGETKGYTALAKTTVNLLFARNDIL